MNNDEQILSTLNQILEVQKQALAQQREALANQEKAIGQQQLAIQRQHAHLRLYKGALVVLGVVLVYVIYTFTTLIRPH